MTDPPTSKPVRSRQGPLKHYLAIALSLLPTPLLLFISSSSEIFLRNQSLLQYQYQVLSPFAKLAMLTLLMGTLLSVLSRYMRVFRFALCVYYLTGPFFLLFAFFRAFESKLPILGTFYQTTGGLALWPVLLFLAAAVLSRRLSPQVIRAFAVFGALLFAYEGGTLFYNVSSHRSSTETSARSVDVARTTPSRPLPNIYHLIFDAYQTDLFEHTLTPEAQRALGGFVYFPRNTAVVAYTPMSLASVFSGRRYSYDRSRADYMRAAYKSKASLLYWLRSQGYETFAYVTNAWRNRDGLFDHMVRHGDAAMDELLAINSEALWNLWLYANIPTPLRDRVMRTTWFSRLNEEDLQQLGEQRLLPHSAPVTSYLGLRKMMAEEETLPASGRYTLVHVVIPHDPLKLEADCTYSVGSSTTGVLEQSQCALKLIVEFSELLKELGRFDDSLLLIHGDHGGPYRTRNGTLVGGARSRSLDAVLLVKPVGAPSGGRLEILDSETSLLDIPSIVMNSVADRDSNSPKESPWSRPGSVVPFIEGELIDSAELILKRHGFALGEVSQIHSERHPKGTVISQDPPAYQNGHAREEVAVVLSLGHADDDDVMPDFVGRDVALVSDWLRRRQTPASSIRRIDHAGAPEGMIVRQTPQAGTRTDGGEEIVFYVSKGH